MNCDGNMIKYNIAFQKKIEDILGEGGYIVRYEKGNFNSGFCVLEKKRVVVINKFHALDSKINSLIEILSIVDLDFEAMSDTTKKLFHELTQKQEATLL
ncbi:MAG: hypothetical protein JWO03_1689 [Bacteroidetes bacterium]|nr:hypothetical protein [Bacteroidota bacterium]